MNYPKHTQGCSSCEEPYNYSSNHTGNSSDCYKRTNECYRPQCFVNEIIDGETVSIDINSDKGRKCRDKPAQCKGCSNSNCCTANCFGCSDVSGFCKAAFRESEQKKIWHQVRVPSTLFMMNLAALNVYETPSIPHLNSTITLTPQQEKERIDSYFNTSFKKGVRSQMSDRLQLSNRHIPGQKNPTVIPSHGNTTRRTTTAHRPGASRPGGVGVDVKHGSYARYLAKRKGKVLTTVKVDKKPLRGNKYQSYNIINKNCCPKPPPVPCNSSIVNNLGGIKGPCPPPTTVDISGCEVIYH